MDPLSVTASVITVLAATGQAAKCVRKISALRHAPLEIKLLGEEASGFSDLLQQVKAIPPANTPRNDASTGLDSQIARITAKLKEFENLLDSFAPQPTRFGVDRRYLGWYKGRQKAAELQKDLTSQRLSLAASLGAQTLTKTDNIEGALEKVTSQNEETAKVLTALVSLIGSYVALTPSTLEVTPDGVDCSFNILVENTAESPEPSNLEHSSDLVTMTRHQKHLPLLGGEPAFRVYAKKSAAYCRAWCSCSCHKRNVIRLKQPFQNDKGGSLTFAYSGLPWITTECNENNTCASKSVPSISTTIHFPAWFWRRYVSTSLTYNPLDGPNLSFTAPRTRDWTPVLWKHAQEGNIHAIQDLFSSRTASARDVSPINGSALHFAAGNRNYELCGFLIAQGALPEHEDDFKNSGTSLAWDNYLSKNLTAEQENVVVSVFSDTEYLQNRLFTVLHKVVLGLVPKDLEDELQYSTKDIDAVDSSGRTCVSWAAGRGDLARLRILLSHGADPNKADIRGSAPLHHVRDAACCQILLERRADALACNSFGHSTLISATRSKDCVPLLVMLVEAGVDVNKRDYCSETALCHAYVVLEKMTDTARFLIDNGADMNAATQDKNTILHLAVQHDAHGITRLLLDRSADYTLQNAYGLTILHIAARLSNSETIDILQDHGLRSIDATAKDCKGKTAMDYVEQRKLDAMEPDFREKFEALHRSIIQTQIAGLTAQIVAIEMGANMIKTATMTSLTPVTSEDEDVSDSDDFVMYDPLRGQKGGHGTVVFYDAVEHPAAVLPVQS